MNSQLNPIAQTIDDVNMRHLPIVVKNDPKKCARPPGRPESDPKVFGPTISFFSKVTQIGVPSLSGRKRVQQRNKRNLFDKPYDHDFERFAQSPRCKERRSQMILQHATISRRLPTRGRRVLPHMVENGPKLCALPEGRVESEWKVCSPSLELKASRFSKISSVFFQNPPINFPLRKFETMFQKDCSGHPKSNNIWRRVTRRARWSLRSSHPPPHIVGQRRLLVARAHWPYIGCVASEGSRGAK